VAANTRRIEPWPLVLLGMLALMIGVCVAFVRVAILHPDALVVRDSWTSEPAVADAMRGRERAESEGLHLAVRTRPEEGGVAVEATLRDAGGRPLEAERVLVLRERPAEGGLDAEVALVRQGDLFAGHVPLPRAGRWQLTVRAAKGDALLEERVALRGPG